MISNSRGSVGLLASSLLLVSCGYQQSVIHPTMAGTSAADTALTCEQLDVAIDRADTVRWVIRDDGGRLETSGKKTARYAANAIIVPISFLAMAPAAIEDHGHSVLNAVDRRILQLLELKRIHGCPVRATAIAGMDDRVLTDNLEAVQTQLDHDVGSQAELFEERTRLLDGLRVVASSPSTGL